MSSSCQDISSTDSFILNSTPAKNLDKHDKNRSVDVEISPILKNKSLLSTLSSPVNPADVSDVFDTDSGPSIIESSLNVIG